MVVIVYGSATGDCAPAIAVSDRRIIADKVFAREQRLRMHFSIGRKKLGLPPAVPAV
jgi:hypothetical protein